MADNEDVRHPPSEKVPITIYGRGTDVLTPEYVPFGGFTELVLGANDTAFRHFQRWSSIFDDPDNRRMPSDGEYKMLVGDRQLPYVKGQTVGELKRAIETYDREAWHRQIPKGWQYAVGDMLATMVTDPASIAATVATGPAYALARPLIAGRSILGGALLSEGLAAGAFATAYIPAEMALSKAGGEEPTTFGEAAMESVGPLAWLGALPSAALTARSLYSSRLADSVMQDLASSPVVSERNIPTQEVVDDIRENPVIPVPPVTVREPMRPPRVELEERFKDYPGGVDKWVRDMFHGDQAAEEFGAARGLSRDKPGVQEFLQAAERLSADTMQLPPDVSRKLMSALDAGHQRTPEQVSLLKQHRMLDDAGELKPEFKPLAVEPLPKELADAPAVYRVGSADVRLEFESEVDRALYAAKPGVESPARRWAIEQGGVPEAEVDAAIKKVRAAARTAAQKAAAKAAPKAAPDPKAQVAAAVQELDRGGRILFADVREKVPHLTKEQFDKALLDMQADGSLALMHLDAPWQRNKRIDDASIQVVTSRYHLTYVSDQGKLAANAAAGRTGAVRGEGKPLLAPNGKPSKLNAYQWEQVRTPAFKRWFGDWENDPANASKVVDENGEPLVVYHGTKADFKEFSQDTFGKNFSTTTQNAFFFIDSPTAASQFAELGTATGSGPNVKPVFLKIDRWVEPVDYALSRYTGKENIGFKYKWGDNQTVYAAFRPEQIKSAIDIEGDFAGAGKLAAADTRPAASSVPPVFKRRVVAEKVAARERFARTGPPDIAAYRASDLTQAIDTALAHSNPFEPARMVDDPDVAAARAFSDPDPEVERIVELIRKRGGDEKPVLDLVDETLGAMGQCRSQ